MIGLGSFLSFKMEQIFKAGIIERPRAESTYKVSGEEWNEAKEVNARLIELGETPVVAIDEYPVITDIKEMLEYDCKDSAEALPVMSKCLSMFEDDYVTKAMIQKFIIDEQEHFNWVKQHLNLIKEIGYENYLIEMLGD